MAASSQPSTIDCCARTWTRPWASTFSCDAAPTSTAYALVQHVREWVRVVPEADGAPFPEERLVKGMDERDALTAVIGAFLTPTEAAAALRSRAYWWPGLQIRCTL